MGGVVKVGMEPNSGWKYSGEGFTLLQLLVEETSGQSFDAFMKDNLFKPLNMTSSTHIWNDSLNNRLCEFYHSNNTLAPHLYYTSLAATSLEHVGDLGFGLHAANIILFGVKIFAGLPVSDRKFCLD